MSGKCCRMADTITHIRSEGHLHQTACRTRLGESAMGFGPSCWRVSSRPWCGRTASCPASTMAPSRPCSSLRAGRARGGGMPADHVAGGPLPHPGAGP
eukprot:330558-Chlamydomonas_euryale.AAC.1